VEASTTSQVDKVKTKFDQVDRSFEELTGTAASPTREAVASARRGPSRDRNLPVDGELFATPIASDEDADDDTETPPGGTIRMLGA
jgi:hypothetical protein